MSHPDLFPALPDDARVWVHTADAPISAEVQESLLTRLRRFLEDWASHGRPVTARVEVLEDRFLVLAATVPGGDVSGCGIDAAVQAIDEAAQDVGIAWMPALHVAYRPAGGAVRTVSRPTFRTKVDDGTVTADTRVYDPSVTALSDVRTGDFVQRAGDAWHGRVFQIPQTA